VARVDIEVSRISYPDGSSVVLVFDLDNTNLTDNDWSNCDLFAVKLTNTTGRNAHVLLRRSNQAPWRDVDIGPGSQTFTTGGPVRRVGDIPSYELRV